jgi:hypothetical protein
MTNGYNIVSESIFGLKLTPEQSEVVNHIKEVDSITDEIGWDIQKDFSKIVDFYANRVYDAIEKKYGYEEATKLEGGGLGNDGLSKKEFAKYKDLIIPIYKKRVSNFKKIFPSIKKKFISHNKQIEVLQKYMVQHKNILDSIENKKVVKRLINDLYDNRKRVISYKAFIRIPAQNALKSLINLSVTGIDFKYIKPEDAEYIFGNYNHMYWDY